MANHSGSGAENAGGNSGPCDAKMLRSIEPMQCRTDTMGRVFLGFDPGGERSFGVAWLRGTQTNAATVSSVAEAIAWAVSTCDQAEPIAAGIDTMLCWCDGLGGWRPADRSLRDAYPAARSSVISPNGLYGAMGIGGMALAIRLRQRWPGVDLNETHPKLFAYALRGELHRDDNPAAVMAWFARHSELDLTHVSGGHALDAILSAWATREGLAREWTDLVTYDPAMVFPVGKVKYLWPEPLARGPVTVRSPKPAVVRGARTSRGTTEIGFVNRNNQTVIRRTDVPGTDHGQRVYVLHCGQCGHEYGANGSDIFLRKCPRHAGGAAGLPY